MQRDRQTACRTLLLLPRKISQQYDILEYRGLVVIARVDGDQRCVLLEGDAWQRVSKR